MGSTEVEVSQELLDLEMPGLDEEFHSQPLPVGVSIPKVENRRVEQLRINQLARERRWYREQQEVYAAQVGITMRAAHWDALDQMVLEYKRFADVFGFIMQERSDSGKVEDRTARIEKAIELLNAPADWLKRWQLYSQMV